MYDLQECVQSSFSERPPLFNLKKNATSALRHRSRMSVTHAGSTRRAPGPIPRRRLPSRCRLEVHFVQRPKQGFRDRNFTRAPVLGKWSRRSGYFSFSMLTPIQMRAQFLNSRRPFRQDLVLMPVRLVHHGEDPLDIFQRHILVKEAADSPRTHGERGGRPEKNWACGLAVLDTLGG
jgi:hypothetical protein